VTQGLTAGDQLVVRGFEPLSEGALVQITERTTLEAAVSAAASGDVPRSAASGAPAGSGGAPGGSAHSAGSEHRGGGGPPP